MKNRSVARAGLAIAVFAAAAARGARNFSGEWRMNPAKSDFGKAPAPDLLVRTIRHTDPSLEISTHQKGSQGEATTQLKYTTDAKECVNQLPGGEARGTAKWEGIRLVIESTRTVQGSRISGKEIWLLSDGGRTLTILNHVSVSGGAQQQQFDVKYVFDKQ